MDMNNPRKRSFSSSGLPQDLSRIKKRKKKPSKSKLKGKSVAPAEEDQPVALTTKPKLTKRSKAEKKEALKKEAPVRSTNVVKQETFVQRIEREARSIKQEPGLAFSDAPRAATEATSGSAKKSGPLNATLTKPDRDATALDFQQKPLKKKRKLPGGRSGILQNAPLHRSVAKAKTSKNDRLEAMDTRQDLDAGATLSKGQRKRRKKAAMAARLLEQQVTPNAAIKQERVDNFQLDWDDIEQSAARYLETEVVDWGLISSVQRQQLEERYIGRPNITQAANSTVNHVDEVGDASYASNDSLSSEESDSTSSEESDVEVAVSVPAPAGTHKATPGARDSSERQSPDSSIADSPHVAQQQPPTISLQETRPDVKIDPERLLGSPRVSGRGTMKPLQARRLSSVPTPAFKHVSLVDTQAKFNRLTAALKNGGVDSSSDDSSSSSDSESESETAAKPIMRGSVAETFADRMPTESAADKADRASETSSDEEMKDPDAVADQIQHGDLDAHSSAHADNDIDGDMPDRAEHDSSPNGTIAAVKHNPSSALSEDSSSISSSSEDTSDEELEAVMPTAISTVQDNHPVSDDSSDEDVSDQDMNVDPSSHVSTDAPELAMGATGEDHDVSEDSDVAEVGAASNDEVEGVHQGVHQDDADDSSSVVSSSIDEKSEDEHEPAAQSNLVSTAEKPASLDNDKKRSDESSVDEGSDADNSVGEGGLTEPAAELVSEPTRDESTAIAALDAPNTNIITAASEEEDSDPESDGSEDAAAADQQSPSVHEVTEADEVDEIISEHQSEALSDDRNESDDHSQSGDLMHDAEDAPDFVLNEDGEIVLAPGSSVADNATSDVVETAEVADGAVPNDEDHEMLDNETNVQNNDEEADDHLEEAVGIDGPAGLGNAQLSDEEMDDREDNDVESGEEDTDDEDDKPLLTKVRNEKDQSVQSEDESVDDEEVGDEERNDGHELMDFGSTTAVIEVPIKPDSDEQKSASDSSSDFSEEQEEEEEVDDVLATTNKQSEDEPTTVAQSAEESSQTQLTASQRQEAAGIPSAPYQVSTTANVVIKRTSLSQELSQDLGGTKSGHSQGLPVQASNEPNEPDSPPNCAPNFADIDSQDATSLIDSVSHSVFADTRPLPEGEGSYSELPKAHTEDELMTEADSVAKRQSTLKQPSSHDELRSSVQDSSSLHQVSDVLSPQPEPTDSVTDSSDDEDSDTDSDDMGFSSVSRTHPTRSDKVSDVQTPQAIRKTRDRMSVASTLPPEVQAAIAMATGTPQTTSVKKRKMTGNTSTHFSTPTRSKPTSHLQADDPSNELEKPQRHDPSGANVEVLLNTPRKKKSLIKKTGTISEHFITDRVDLYNTTAGMRRKVPAGQSANPCPPLDSATFGIIQERTCHEPFWLIIATVFLNKTTGRQAAPAFWKIRETWPSPAKLAAADYDALFDMIKHLGFQTQRTKRLKSLAAAWEAEPPIAGKRYRTLHYPSKGDGKQYKPAQIIEEDANNCAGALEIAHIPGCGAYAYDSWRIFCRDVLRGVATDYLGTNSKGDDFEPEWKRVLPQDKELRACLRWMWLKEGFVWDPLTGSKRPATEEELARAKDGDMDFQDVMEAKFAAQAAGQDVSSPEKAARGGGDGMMGESKDLTTDDARITSAVDDGADWALKHSQISEQAKDDDDDDIVAVPFKAKAKSKSRAAPRKAQVQVQRLQGQPTAKVGRVRRTRSPSLEIDERKSSPVVEKKTIKKVAVPKKKSKPATATGAVLDSDGLV